MKERITKFKKRIIKYVVLLIALGIFGYFSVEVTPLDEWRNLQEEKEFNASKYARDFWDDVLMSNLDKAANAEEVIGLLKTDRLQAQEKFGVNVGIGQISRYYFLSGTGKVLTVNDETVGISICEPQTHAEVEVTIGFFYGNVARNCSGLIDVSTFSSSQHANDVSEAINKIISTEVLPDFQNKIQPDMTVMFTGGTEIMNDESDFLPLKMIPVKLDIQ